MIGQKIKIISKINASPFLHLLYSSTVYISLFFPQNFSFFCFGTSKLFYIILIYASFFSFTTRFSTSLYFRDRLSIFAAKAQDAYLLSNQSESFSQASSEGVRVKISHGIWRRAFAFLWRAGIEWSWIDQALSNLDLTRALAQRKSIEACCC